MTKKQILLNAFNMNCVGHINHGLWTHPRDTSTAYKTLDYWTGLARLLERGLFDGLFLADIVGVYDVYQDSADLTLRESIQLPVNDPLLIVPAMAAATRHLGFGVTVNLTYEAPYLLARRFSTLDHLTQGRVGWNIVTGYLESAARAMGLSGQIAHDERYDRADEFLDVAYQLWEGSWDADAVKADKRARVYADPAAVRRVDHAGKYYRVQGYHLAEPSPQRTPVLYQAGLSGRGWPSPRAMPNACSFPARPGGAAQAGVRAARGGRARGPRSARHQVLHGHHGRRRANGTEARDKHAEYLRYASPEAGLAHYASSTGIDFSTYAPDEPIRYVKNNAIESAVRSLTVARTDRTVRDLLADMALGGRYPALVGSAAQVADELESWVAETGIDGFNLARTVTPECYEDFIDLVIPELQSRGSYKTAYADGTLRERVRRGPGGLAGRTRARAPGPPTPERAARMR